MIQLNRRLFLFGVCLLAASLLLSACRPQSTPTSTSTAPALTQPAPTTPVPTAAPTAAPRSLVVCLGQEPETLYPYGRGSASMWSILDSVYDGPIDRRNYTLEPVILQKIPSLSDPDAVIQPVSVAAGDEVIDANGDLATLVEGVKIHPSGCTGPDCAVAYDGKSPVQMDQMVVTFKLLPGLTWSDGDPLTASDSVYSFKLASDPATPVAKYAVDRTASYQAADKTSVAWTGKPGYLPTEYASNFWMPLPEHLWGTVKPGDLLQLEAAAQKPVGWGPYIIDEWVKGDHIQLHKNPNYFRAKEDLPKFDVLVYRFVGENATANVNALLTGECDLVDPTANLEQQLPLVRELQQAKKLTGVYAAGPEWEHLDFGIRPASYDDGYNPAAGDRPDLFADVRTRQAVAQCADRQGIIDQLLGKQSSIPASYLPAQHPAYNPDLKPLPYDPGAGAKLLDEAGWKDADQNPATPRVAQGVKNVPDGTPLVVSYQTTQAALRQKVAEALADSLAQCGIQVKTQTISPGELFAPGPDGPLFGRHFDLAAFSWEAGPRIPCFLYMTSRIPDAANHWVGENITGYSNPAFDAACQAALQALPGQPGYQESQAKAQEIFAAELPVIPLYQHPQAAASRPDLCGFSLDPTARSSMWNIEAFDVGTGCAK